ncbi:hypothetical protein Hamer_G021641 [Homarus americanus]|uniref:Uncharacterized protein n=1 Tax=Homarus americanus TaxID=6706 RepID=A0A8J5MQQ0_HOMAM|nr:hypothetical protein Hamer_G021641 [Homarus americanus]
MSLTMVSQPITLMMIMTVMVDCARRDQDGFENFKHREGRWRADGWRADGWRADGWRADGWRADGWRADGWRADGWRADGWKGDLSSLDVPSIPLDHSTGTKLPRGPLKLTGVSGKAEGRDSWTSLDSQRHWIFAVIQEAISTVGYGEGTAEMVEFHLAEENGLSGGDCSKLYPLCPVSLAGLLHDCLSYLHGGLVSAGGQV